jgi:hypothetical protein
LADPASGEASYGGFVQPYTYLPNGPLSGQLARLEGKIKERQERPKNPPPSIDDITESIALLVDLAEVAAKQGEPELFALAAGVRGIVKDVRLRFERRLVRQQHRGWLVSGDVCIKTLTPGVESHETLRSAR